MDTSLQLHMSPHATVYFLNFTNSIIFIGTLIIYFVLLCQRFYCGSQVKMRLYITLQTKYPNLKDRIKIDKQLDRFKRAQGMFGLDMASATTEKIG